MSMAGEIAQQVAVVERLLATGRDTRRSMGALASGCTHVVVAARGTSDNAARYAQYVWGARNRLSVGLTTPSLFSVLGSPPRLEGALVVGISQSGQSPDLVEVLATASREGRPTVAITNDPASPMARVADVVVDLCAGEERAVAATKTYTAQLTAVAACSVALAGGDETELAALPGLLSAALGASEGVVDEVVAGLVEADRCVVVGRGHHLATVFEWALKLQELTYLLAQPFSAADFLHGPVAVVEEGFPVLVVATAGPTHEQMAALATDMMERGAHVVTATDVAGTPGSVIVPIPPADPWLSPIVIAPIVQRFALALTLSRGQDPDAPRGLTKVTRTR
jgi:glutamine---fructose-6-phosphate transaminase (isomerizing)